MRLSRDLQLAIEHETSKIDRGLLAQASAQLTQQYKAANFASPVLATAAQRAAYLAVRLPATYAASWRVFSEVRRLVPETEIGSLLDLGAGPGTALFAAAEVFPAIQQATLIESDAALIDLGRGLAAQSPLAVVRSANWLRHDLRSGLPRSPHDLVVISYTLGELPSSAAEMLVRQAWSCANEFLVVIEPGTMRGFGAVHAARSLLIAAGGHILAPCPHAAACPLAGSADDWCHFAQRVERTSQHRQLKGGALGYEDEKFSYVVAARKSSPSARARILRHPRKLSGHVQLTLCGLHGVESQTITRSQKGRYKLARKAQWGDAWNGPGEAP
jgi:ribosomal protein RSM22 (predicted rRNA methylase)